MKKFILIAVVLVIASCSTKTNIPDGKVSIEKDGITVTVEKDADKTE